MDYPLIQLLIFVTLGLLDVGNAVYYRYIAGIDTRVSFILLLFIFNFIYNIIIVVFFRFRVYGLLTSITRDCSRRRRNKQMRWKLTKTQTRQVTYWRRSVLVAFWLGILFFIVSVFLYTTPSAIIDRRFSVECRFKYFSDSSEHPYRSSASPFLNRGVGLTFPPHTKRRTTFVWMKNPSLFRVLPTSLVSSRVQIFLSSLKFCSRRKFQKITVNSHF